MRMKEVTFSSEPTDYWRVGDRSHLTKEVILPAVWGGAEGLFTLQDLTSAQTILDVACGRGALAMAATELGATASFIGIDTYDYGKDRKTPTAYELYRAVRVGSIRDRRTLCWTEKWNYDLIISICTHLNVYSYLAQNRDRLSLKPGGKIVLISEIFLKGDEFAGFQLTSGREYNYQIGIWQKG